MVLKRGQDKPQHCLLKEEREHKESLTSLFSGSFHTHFWNEQEQSVQGTAACPWVLLVHGGAKGQPQLLPSPITVLSGAAQLQLPTDSTFPPLTVSVMYLTDARAVLS